MREVQEPDPNRGGRVATMSFQNNMDSPRDEEAKAREIADFAASERRFYVRAPSVSAVRRALFRAPGGARVVGRHDRETIECSHTMDQRSFDRHWPILLSRLDKAGLGVTNRPESGAHGLDG